MTDKKIKIDVSNCMYLDGNYCPNHDTKCDFVDFELIEEVENV